MQEIQSPASSFILFCKTDPAARVMRNWIRSLDVQQVTLSGIPEKFRTGIFAFQVLDKIGIRFNREKVFFSPQSKKDCLQNLRYLLRVLGKIGLGTFEFSEKSLYLGKSEEVWKIIQFLFEDVYFKRCFKVFQDVFRWASSVLSMKVGPDNLVQTLKDFQLFAKLVSFSSFLESPSSSFKELEKKLKSAKIPLLFDLEDYKTNENFKFSYIQLFLVFQSFSGQIFKASTDSSSKETIQESSTLFEMFGSPDGKNAETFEDSKNAENFEENSKNAENFEENSKNDENFETNHLILRQVDLALCYLEIPRIVQVYEPERLIRALIQLSEGDDHLAFVDVTDIESRSRLARFQVALIEELAVEGNSCDIFLRNNHVKIVFKSELECEKYSKALSIVYETGNN